MPVIAWALAATPATAAKPEVFVTLHNNLFDPVEVIIPANTKVKLVVINQDPTSEEFESYELNREKVIMGNSKAVIFIGPVPPGEYPFFGEFHPNSAIGKIVAR